MEQHVVVHSRRHLLAWGRLGQRRASGTREDSRKSTHFPSPPGGVDPTHLPGLVIRDRCPLPAPEAPLGGQAGPGALAPGVPDLMVSGSCPREVEPLQAQRAVVFNSPGVASNLR